MKKSLQKSKFCVNLCASPDTNYNTMMTATFKAYQGADRDNLIGRLIDCKDWSHISQVRASSEINHVEVDVYFKAHTTRANRAVRNPLMGAWRLQSIK